METSGALLSWQSGQEDLTLFQSRQDFMEVNQTLRCCRKKTLSLSSQRETACHETAPLSSFPPPVPVIFLNLQLLAEERK